VLTSQRVTDVVLLCMRAVAASQGCMNNLTYGSACFGAYETICGGAGAGPGFHGTSGVHTHMTNTRITSVEILERRYPILVREFRLKPGTGGAGEFKGGDGVVRELEFLAPLDVGILSERRTLRPYGLEGGAPGSCGLNLIITKQGTVLNLGAKNTYKAQCGDRIRIETPGGGGYGKESKNTKEQKQESKQEAAAVVVATTAGAGSVSARQVSQNTA
jgi:5-oxoprolinase (ATP-hydrolysing)